MKNFVKKLLSIFGPTLILLFLLAVALLFVAFLGILEEVSAQDTTAYRIRMPTANYSAILILSAVPNAVLE